MQYILTKEEFENLVPKSKYDEEKAKVKMLNEQVLEVSGLTQAMQVNKQLVDIANSLPKPQTDDKEDKLKELANKNLKRLVTYKGVNCYICGYSVEFDCLIAETFDEIAGGVLLSGQDCVLCHDYPFYLYVPKDIVKE